MKKTKLLMPILTVGTIAAATAPMVSCGNNGSWGYDMWEKTQEVELNKEYRVEIYDIPKHIGSFGGGSNFGVTDNDSGAVIWGTFSKCSYKIDDGDEQVVEIVTPTFISFDLSTLKSVKKKLTVIFQISKFEELVERDLDARIYLQLF